MRNILVRKVPGFKSAGHALLVTAYVALNIAVSFTNFTKVELSMGSLASRFGWYVSLSLKKKRPETDMTVII